MPSTLRADLFAVNPNPVLSVHSVGLGKHKVIIADHFYQYPDDVLQTALELPYTDPVRNRGKFPWSTGESQREHTTLDRPFKSNVGRYVIPIFFPSTRCLSGHQDAEFPLKRGATPTPY